MKSVPNSRANLDRAISRFAGDNARELAFRSDMANAIVAQMLGEGVVKGGSGLKLRYGGRASRVTRDLDTARRVDLDVFLKNLRARLAAGWEGFTGEVLVQKQGSPRDVPFEYVMQPCDVKLNYLGKPWFTVKLEIGHNEIGDAETYDVIEVPTELKELFEFLSLPVPAPISAMKLEYQIAQKLHDATSPESRRAHDLIDLQLILSQNAIDLKRTREICHQLFYYRHQQPWPPTVAKLDQWEQVYNERRGVLAVLPTVDEAVAWANDLIVRIENA